MIIGVLGGGQLGRMLGLAGLPLGLSFRFLDPAADCPARAVGEVHTADFDDHTALDRFAAGLDVVTYEFENVPVAAVECLARRVPVFPPPRALQTAQDRLLEKQLFERVGLPVPPYAPVASLDELRAAVSTIGVPAVLKTRRMGYDGKGQAIIRSAADISSAWAAIGSAPHGLIVERFVDFQAEVSVIAVRGQDGVTAAYPLVLNVHRGGILHTSRAPAPIAGPDLQHAAEQHALKIMAELGYVGVLAIEFFVTADDTPRLLGNEFAPRVHNSGHWTIEGAETSQFENHLRAACGWPLGSTAPRGHAAMVNLIGSAPPTQQLLAIQGAHPHLYGKSPRAGRKLGHITWVSGEARDADAKLKLAESKLLGS